MEVIYLGKQRKNYIGYRNGRLTVIDDAPDYISPKGRVVRMCVCQCGCGNVVTLRLFNAIHNTQSCGCWKSEVSKRIAESQKGIRNVKNSKVNEYDLSNDYGIGYTLKGEPFYFDKEDYELIKDYCWYINDSGYLLSRTPIDGKKFRMHRLIMGCLDDKNIVVDHINHDKSDNRKSNLRLVTTQQNTMNHGVSTKNTSGFTGVSFDKDKMKWVASITVNYKNIFLGYFSNIEDAKRARQRAENKYFGDFSYKNSMEIANQMINKEVL